MSATFLRKELRDQRVFAGLGLAMFVVNDVVGVAMSQPDLEPLAENFDNLSGGTAATLMLMAFAIGTGLLAREADDGTLGFLDGLPLSRVRIWGIKLLSALGLLLLYPVLHLVLVAVLHLLSRGALDRAVHAELLLQQLLLVALACAVSLTAGMLLGFARSLSWAALAVVVSIIAWGSSRSTAVHALDPLVLLEPRFVGDQWPVPMRSVLAQGGLAVLFGLSSLLVFLRTGRSQGSLDEKLRRPVISAAVAVVTLAAGVTAAVLISDGDHEPQRGNEEVDGAFFAEAPPGHAATLHYRFSYPGDRGQRVELLLRDGDRQFDAVAGLLGVDGGEPIPVDLWGSSRNTAGTAMHDSIRMGLDSDEDLLGVLAHETTHVVAGRLAREDRNDGLAGMAVLDEGLATWVMRRVAPGDGGATELDRLEAAWVARRKLVEPALVTDREALAAEHDINLQYPLGSAVVEALVQRYGPSAPRVLLETLGREDFPRGLSGYELWAAAFQLAGFDLAPVLDGYARLLSRWATERAAVLDALPRPRGVLTAKGEWVGVEVRTERPLPDGFSTVVRFKPGANSGLETYMFRRAREEDGIAWIQRHELGDVEVCFQPGLYVQDVALYEPWSCLPLEAAGEP